MNKQQHKARERLAKAGELDSVLDGVSLALPALTRAQKLQRRAASVGFDWPDTRGVIDKLQEEFHELEAALDAGETLERVKEELGDLLFSAVNLARHLDADAENLLHENNAKFTSRFATLEALAKEKQWVLSDLSIDDLERLWQQAKHKLSPDA